MLKFVIIPAASTLIALSGFTVTAGAYAQQQPASPEIQLQAASVAGTAQLAARSNGGNRVRTDAAPKVVVPLRQTQHRPPAAQDSDCVGPVSFCNVYFGS
ncbi:hypothetical protein Q3A80_05900 [Burkholderia sp. SR8]|uniref:hypothetical protein n=1 Tax=Burkholderia sp. SR8 TaxID=3062277 RepID=UPI0040638156